MLQNSIIELLLFYLGLTWLMIITYLLGTFVLLTTIVIESLYFKRRYYNGWRIMNHKLTEMEKKAVWTLHLFFFSIV